ncbi:hypothetical protein FRC01_012619 [Tulasnella sp. 417]|nr:hypothetical protein FRC01_012619 [Tulasnella sp. 417]
MVQENMEAGICDFGISKIIVSVGQRSGFTTSGNTLGTQGFQAPEVLNDHPATTASDVFAFAGVILFALSGKAPFEGYSPVAALIAVTGGQMPNRKDHSRLSDMDALWSLLEECWSLQIQARPSMSEILAKVIL